MFRKWFSLTALLSFLLILATLAQTHDQPKSRSRQIPYPRFDFKEDGTSEITPPKNEYTFARLVYNGGWGWRYGSWTTDTPKADVNLAAGIKRLTNLDVTETPFYIPLTSKEIFKYPFLYAVEVGYLQLSQEEADILKEYLMRGGFFVVERAALAYCGDDLEHDMLPKLAADGQLVARRHDGFWRSMDTYKDLLDLRSISALGEPPWLSV